MSMTSTAFTLLASAIGLLAAIWWYRASRVEIVPAWGTGCEPGDNQMSQMLWTAGILEAGMKSGRLNKQAALLTAVSIGLGSIGTIIGFVASN